MSDPLEEQILDFVADKIGTLTIAGGYEVDMEASRVHRPAVGEREYSADDLADGPHAAVWREETRRRWLPRYASEVFMKVCVSVTAATYLEAEKLIGGIHRYFMANMRLNDSVIQLCDRLWVVEQDLPDFDVNQDQYHGRIVIAIKTTVSHASPSLRKDA